MADKHTEGTPLDGEIFIQKQGGYVIGKPNSSHYTGSGQLKKVYQSERNDSVELRAPVPKTGGPNDLQSIDKLHLDGNRGDHDTLKLLLRGEGFLQATITRDNNDGYELNAPGINQLHFKDYEQLQLARMNAAGVIDNQFPVVEIPVETLHDALAKAPSITVGELVKKSTRTPD